MTAGAAFVILALIVVMPLLLLAYMRKGRGRNSDKRN